MFIVRENKKTVNKVSCFDNTVEGRLFKAIVDDFFNFSMTHIKNEHPDVYKALQTSNSVIREVFRHSLCKALDLTSVSAYPYIDIYDEYAERMRGILGDISDWSIEYRQGVLQACIHILAFVTKPRRGIYS